MPLRKAKKTHDASIKQSNMLHRYRTTSTEKTCCLLKRLIHITNTPKMSNAKHISNPLKLAINIIAILFNANLRGLEMCLAMFVLKHPGNCSFPPCNSSGFQLWLELLPVFLISKKNCNQTVYSITIFIFQPLWLKVQKSTISISGGKKPYSQ